MVEKHRYSLIVLTGVETIVENSYRSTHLGTKRICFVPATIHTISNWQLATASHRI